MNIGIIIQARLGSTRLSRKILKPFYENKTLIEVLIENLHKVATIKKIIIATSTNPENDELEQFLCNKGEIVYRGSEDDVLERFIKAAEANNLNGIIRICSDNPFLDCSGVTKLAECAKTLNADYIGYRVNGQPSIKTHFGFWGEFVTLEALLKVKEKAKADVVAHEHVTIYIYTHPEEFTCEWINAPLFLEGRNNIRLTIDTYEDFKNAQHVYSDMMSYKKDFCLEDVIDYLDKHQELISSMQKIIEQNKK